jgi:DNA invertase Pin-like site-specific DNA recombinase
LGRRRDRRLVDEDGGYNPASPNDQLLLGMKGKMSEMALSIPVHSIEAMKQKARRGELFLSAAVGYVKAGGDHHIEKDADRRIQEAITLVSAGSPNFRQSARTGVM